jgi:hypothetical protein
MTGHALTVHAAAVQPAFNTDFYATAAAVIPVLLLAVTLQSRAYQQLSSLKVKATPYLAGVVIGVGGAGEILAIVALYRQAAWYDTPSYVLTATIILVVAVSAAAFLAFVMPDSSAESPAAPLVPVVPARAPHVPPAPERGGPGPVARDSQ